MVYRNYKSRMVMTVLCVFFGSMVMSCQELRYMTWGQTADAVIVDNHYEKTTRKGQVYEKHVLGYTFMDKDKFRREYTDVALNWHAGGSATVKVQYIPGRELQSRLYGERNTVWIVIFFGSLVAAGIGVFWMMR